MDSDTLYLGMIMNSAKVKQKDNFQHDSIEHKLKNKFRSWEHQIFKNPELVKNIDAYLEHLDKIINESILLFENKNIGTK